MHFWLVKNTFLTTITDASRMSDLNAGKIEKKKLLYQINGEEVSKGIVHKNKHRSVKTFLGVRPRGKESIEVRIIQNKGKESENSYQKLK